MPSGGSTVAKKRTPSVTDRFQAASRTISEAAGTVWALLAAAMVVIGWLVSGPLFGFSDTWQLVINTGTTIVTFLMVFAIQATQNRSDRAMQLKLDELIRATKGARNAMIDEEEGLEEIVRRDEERMRRQRKRKEEGR
jgi:low affinity Fe/Cu permease